MLIREAKIRES